MPDIFAWLRIVFFIRCHHEALFTFSLRHYDTLAIACRYAMPFQSMIACCHVYAHGCRYFSPLSRLLRDISPSFTPLLRRR